MEDQDKGNVDHINMFDEGASKTRATLTSTADRIADVIVEEEFLPLSKTKEIIFLPSNFFPNTHRKLTMDQTAKVFDVYHKITGRVGDKNSDEEQLYLNEVMNGVLEEARRYTRTRICKARDIAACRHWEWRVDNKIVTNYNDIDQVLSSRWATTRATMIRQCHSLMHGMYQSKKAAGWFSEGIQQFLDLKKIQLYTTDKNGTRNTVPKNCVGTLLSFAKQARTKINKGRNNTLRRYQGIMIFSGKRGNGIKTHKNKKPVSIFDGGCDGYYIETNLENQGARQTLQTLLSEGHTKAHLIEILQSIDEGATTQVTVTVPDSVSIAHITTNDASNPLDALIKQRFSQPSASTFYNEEDEIQAVLEGGAVTKKPNERDLDSMTLDLNHQGDDQFDHKQKANTRTPTMKATDQRQLILDSRTPGDGLDSKNISKDDETSSGAQGGGLDSKQNSEDDQESNGSTVTEVSANYLGTVAQKNLRQMSDTMKPKPKPAPIRKPAAKKIFRQGTRQSHRRSPEGSDKDEGFNNKEGGQIDHVKARRSLQVSEGK